MRDVKIYVIKTFFHYAQSTVQVLKVLITCKIYSHEWNYTFTTTDEAVTQFRVDGMGRSEKVTQLNAHVKCKQKSETAKGTRDE